MKLFARKPAPPQPPPLTPEVLAAHAPTAPPKPDPQLNETSLKLNLPDVFAFDEDETKAKLNGKRRKTDDDPAVRSRGSILLVESDEEVCRLIARLLEHEGYQIAKASCLAEAKTALNDFPADYLLARRHCVPLNLQTEHVLRDLHTKTSVRIVDDFSELLLGQVIDYESVAQCTLGLTDLLLSLLEGANIGARGHAHCVAKYTRLLGQQLGLSRRELDAVTLAALIHDLGSLETRRQIGDALYSRSELLPASVRSTLDMLANIQFPYEINELINAAAGLTPDAALQSSRFAKSAHILRVADAYDSLRRANPDQPATDDQIFAELRRQAAVLFDSHALETFIHLRKNEQLISAMNIFWAAILIVDPNPAEQQLLRLRLENNDCHVEFAQSVEEALTKLRQNNFTLVVTEHKLTGRGDGFELLRTLKLDPELRRLPVIFHSTAGTDLVKYALELGAEDWLAKPHNVEIMAMKIQRIIARHHSTRETGGDGVRGSLRDMGIMEMVQILNAGNRSVVIALENGKRTGELTLQTGQIIAAAAGELLNESAAIELLQWDDGQFRIAPLRDAPAVTIRTSTDNLLLQACYLRDKQDNPDARGLRL
jgi:response regulator RpfG family c-di-GMP phosphodiesterase